MECEVVESNPLTLTLPMTLTLTLTLAGGDKRPGAPSLCAVSQDCAAL